MFHSPQSNADDHSLICPPHPVRKFSGFHFRRFLIPLLLLASCGLLQTLLAGEKFEPIKPEGEFVSERINLFGVPTDLMIQQQIYETVRTWSQVREITLKYLDAQPQDKPSLREAEKRLQDIRGKLAQKYNKGVRDLAAKRGESIWDTAAIFQGAEGSAIAPETQDTSDILNGLYQIQTALELKNEKK
jgi:hypothetical protein